MDRAKDILPRVFKDQAFPDGDRDLIFSLWGEVVGARIAAQAQPATLANSLLLVEVHDPGWLGQLELLAGKLRDRINAALGRRVVRRIAFRPARAAAQPPPIASSAAGEADGVQNPLRRRVYLASKRAAGYSY